MFYDFFYTLKEKGLPASLHEYLNLMDAMDQNAIGYRVDDFYGLCKAIFVKHESHLDVFDQIFGHFFNGLEDLPAALLEKHIPDEWLRDALSKNLTPQERAEMEAIGDLDDLMEKFKEILDEQDEAHHGGNKWIGTKGTSPFGSQGKNPEGIKVGNEGMKGNRSAVKMWNKRQFKNLRGDEVLNTRNIKLALKRLRHFTREGIQDELDLPGTIRRTSENAGMLDITMQAPKKNRVKVLMLMDIGGSMDEHVALCEQLFSSAKHEFKHLKFFYFHNCVYQNVWKDNKLKYGDTIPTLELINKYGRDYKLIYVGDAAMAPYELFYTGGAIDHENSVSGINWIEKLNNHFKHSIWINPTPFPSWDYFETVSKIRQTMEHRMFPMTLTGLGDAMKCLKNNKLNFTDHYKKANRVYK